MCTGISASRDRREKGDFIARLHRRRRLRHFLIDGDAQGLPQRAQARDGGYRGSDIELLARSAELLAQAGEIEDPDFHRYSSEYGMNFTASPARIARFAGLSTSPSAHAVDVSTAESCVG